jgi:cardiolipin synthase
MRATRRLLAVTLAAVAAVAAWHLGAGTGHGLEPALLPAGVVAASGHDRLVVEPDAGMAPIEHLLASPRHTLDLSVYELADPTAEAALTADAARGVRVRVILDERREGSTNAAAARFLRARGVSVHWASRRFYVSHEKAFVVDGRIAVVMSLNLAARYYPTTRDVAVVDRDPVDVQAIEAVFAADFAGRPIRAPTGDDLAWSPDRSEPDLVALIQQARHSLLVESEELADQPVIDALAAAARRGVAVGVVMTDQSDWHPAFDELRSAGGRVWVLHGETPLYIHAKLYVADAGRPGARALVGSQNVSVASLTEDRELGVVLTAPKLVTAVGRVIEADAAAGTPWA